MNDIPIAVISGASRGAPRSGRYAIRSIVALISPQAAIATTSEQTIASDERARSDACVVQAEDA